MELLSGKVSKHGRFVYNIHVIRSIQVEIELKLGEIAVFVDYGFNIVRKLPLKINILFE